MGDGRDRSILVLWLIAGLFVLASFSVYSWSSRADDANSNPAAPATEKLGLQVGEKVPTFYVRAITGPLKDKSVCYVCRNGERPVVMLFVREITPELPALFRLIDELVDRHRADGLRSFAIFVSRDSRELLPQVQTLAFNNKITLPLTISAAPGDGPISRQSSPEAAVTVILYRDQTVIRHAAFRPGELKPDRVTTIADQIRELAVGSEVR